MSFFQEDGVLTSRTSTGTDVVTLTGSGASLDVKLVRLVLTGDTATGGANADFMIVIGFSDGTDDRCVFASSEDNVGTSNCDRTHHDDSVLSVYNPAGTLLDQGTISAIGAGTFTINWPTTKSATAYKIGWTAWGGTDLTGVEVGNFSADTTSGAHTQNVSTTIKSASAAMFLSAQSTAALNSAPAAIARIMLGFSDGTNEGAANVNSQDATALSDTKRYQRTNASIVAMNESGTKVGDGSITLDATNGIQVAWDANKLTAAFVFIYVLVKGGRWEVGSGTTHTSAATKSYTTAFQPVGVSTMSVGNAASSSVVSQNIFSLGSSDSTSSFSFSVGDEDGFGTTQTGTYHSTANVVQTFTATQLTAGGGIASLIGEGTFDSFNATDVTLDFTGNPDSFAREFIWLVCAENASTGGVVRRIAGEGGLAGMGGIAGLHGGLAG